MTPLHHKVLSLFTNADVGSGVTVPAHIPGEPTGSSNLATRTGEPFPSHNPSPPPLVDAFAFPAARRVAGLVRAGAFSERSLTPRQRDFLIWAMRGKTNWEMAPQKRGIQNIASIR